MQVADGLLPFACSQIFGCDEEVEHSAVVELQAPVVVAVQLQERKIVWVFLFGLLEIRFAKQFEAIGTLFAVDERQFLGGQSKGSPVLAHYPVRIQVLCFGSIQNAVPVLVPLSHSWRVSLQISQEVINVGKEVQHSRVWQEVLAVVGRYILESDLADECHRVGTRHPVFIHPFHLRVIATVRQVSASPQLAHSKEFPLCFLIPYLYSHIVRLVKCPPKLGKLFQTRCLFLLQSASQHPSPPSTSQRVS